MREIATNLDQIFRNFSARPLEVQELKKFYVPAKEGRGADPTWRIKNMLVKNQDINTHILFAGYRGCGKSTELNRLQSQLQDDFLVINFSVMQELDVVSLHYIELFIVTMEKLFTFAKEHKLDINQEYLDSINLWMSSTEIQEIKDKYIGTDAEVGVDAKITIPFLAGFFTKFKAVAKVSKSLKEVLTTNVEPKLSQLIDLCNQLINEIRINLKEIGKKDMLLIMEDLDKIPLDRAKELFFNYSKQLSLLQINCIFTYPIALFHSPLSKTIGINFDTTYELPMIKVHPKDDHKKIDEDGVGIMKSIIAKRMNIDLFEEESIMMDAIKYSGGCIRDLFTLIKESADNALEFERLKITKKDFQQAYYKLKKEYDNTIADKSDENGKVLTSVKDYFEALVNLVNSDTKKPENTDVVLDLRQNLTILGYNGEGWCDVHPIVRDILIERKKI
jgi:hypothetical protein